MSPKFGYMGKCLRDFLDMVKTAARAVVTTRSLVYRTIA